MNIRLELVAQAIPELQTLLDDYFARTQAKEDLPPLRMNWGAYIALNDRRELLLFTARDGDTLLGFVMYHIQSHLHHRDTIWAICDILAVDVDARGRGIAREMMAVAEPVLRQHGAKLVTHGFRTCYDVEPLFPKLGYKLIEHAYMKGLGQW